MSKDTYSDDKKIESFKSLEIASGQNTSSGNGNLTLSTSNENNVLISPDKDTRISGVDTYIQPSNYVQVLTRTVDITTSFGDIALTAVDEIRCSSATHRPVTYSFPCSVSNFRTTFVFRFWEPATPPALTHQ